jgi:DNA-binding beta-propeller fold protein YncE
MLLALCGCAAAQTAATIAGTGVPGFSGDGGPGVRAQINNPYGLAVGPDGALYFCEIGNHRVRWLDLKTGVISTFAGSGEKGYSGDGGPATSAAMNEPYEIAFDRAGNLYIDEMQNHVVRKIDAKTRIITTVAGTGIAGFSGDGGPAAKAQLRQPHSIAFDPEGRLLICDIGNHRVRRVDVVAGTIETWAGTGERKPTPDGSPIAGTPLNGPRAVAVAPDGQMYLALREGNAIYRIDPKAGRIHHLAGTGESGRTGDGGPATQAKLAGPKGISWAPNGSVYIADTESHTIRRIDLKSGVITTVLEDLKRPHGIFVAKDGTVYVGDSEKHRILMLKP